MKWITANHLEELSRRIDFRTILPGLVADLIKATVNDIDDIENIRFPNGDKGQVRGWDGYLISKTGHTYIPQGNSVWEFGVSKDTL